MFSVGHPYDYLFAKPFLICRSNSKLLHMKRLRMYLHVIDFVIHESGNYNNYVSFIHIEMRGKNEKFLIIPLLGLTFHFVIIFYGPKSIPLCKFFTIF